MLIVRYKRNASEDSIKIDRKPKNILEAFHDDDVDPASQLVARYNGSEEIPEVRTSFFRGIDFSKHVLAIGTYWYCTPEHFSDLVHFFHFGLFIVFGW